jgi:hypothetical protein
LKTNSHDSKKTTKHQLRRRHDQTTRPIFFSAGGNSQENFTKNLCWRRIGLTQLKTTSKLKRPKKKTKIKQNFFSFPGGNSQENFTKNLCWRRIGLTQ